MAFGFIKDVVTAPLITTNPAVKLGIDAADEIGIGDYLDPRVNIPDYQPDAYNFRFDNRDFEGRFADALNQGVPDRRRGDRDFLFSTLRDRVSGQAPSVAEQQLMRGIEQSQAQQFAQAASRGFDPAAFRAASINASAANQNLARDAATLRAQEQQSAEALFAQALAQERAQDIQEQQTLNQLTLGYEQVGFNRDQAASLARQALEETRLREFLGRIGAEQGAAQNRTQLLGALLRGSASGIAGAL